MEPDRVTRDIPNDSRNTNEVVQSANLMLSAHRMRATYGAMLSVNKYSARINRAKTKDAVEAILHDAYTQSGIDCPDSINSALSYEVRGEVCEILSPELARIFYHAWDKAFNEGLRT